MRTKLLFVLLISVTFRLSAQEKFGVKIGANYTALAHINFDGEFVNGEVNQALFTYPAVGVFYQNNLTNWLGYEASLLFNQKGGDRWGRNPSLSNSFSGGYSPSAYLLNSSEKLSYLTLPIDFLLFPNNKLSLVTGLSASYLLASECDNEVIFLPKKQLDFACRLGLKYSIGKVDLKLVYSHSLIPCMIENEDEGLETKYFNQGFQASVSVPINGLFK